METYDIVINILFLIIIYKAVFGSIEGLKYIFFIWFGLLLYFRGLKRGGFFYRILNDDYEDVYIIRPLKEYLYIS